MTAPSKSGSSRLMGDQVGNTGIAQEFLVTPAMLDAVEVGDKVRFQAQKMGGAIVITELQPVK